MSRLTGFIGGIIVIALFVIYSVPVLPEKEFKNVCEGEMHLLSHGSIWFFVRDEVHGYPFVLMPDNISIHWILHTSLPETTQLRIKKLSSEDQWPK